MAAEIFIYFPDGDDTQAPIGVLLQPPKLYLTDGYGDGQGNVTCVMERGQGVGIYTGNISARSDKEIFFEDLTKLATLEPGEKRKFSLMDTDTTV